MPANPRLYVHDWVHFVTTRIESGLPMAANVFIEAVLKSIFARACELYPVKASDLVVMANHVHFLLTVLDPQHVDQFIRYFKTESAHAINRLLGRGKGRVWEESYDAPIVLELDALIERVVYIYTNPQKANLVETIEQYPNVCTWKEFLSGTAEPEECLRISRLDLERLPRHATQQKWESLKQELTEKVKKRQEEEDPQNLREPLMLAFYPRAAFEALDEGEMTYEEYRLDIEQRVRAREQELSRERIKAHTRVLGVQKLKEQSPYRAHTPTSRGRKMICLAVDTVLRCEFIKVFKDWVQKCRAVYREWRAGDYDVPFPAGFFPPATRPKYSLIPGAFWG